MLRRIKFVIKLYFLNTLKQKIKAKLLGICNILTLQLLYNFALLKNIYLSSDEFIIA